MDPSRVRVPSWWVVFGLVVAIAATDVITTRLTPAGFDALVKPAIVLAFLIWSRRAAGLTWEELGLGRSHVGAGLRLGALTALIIGAVIALAVAVPASRGYFDNHAVAADSTAQRVLEPLLWIPLGTVVFEELIFRGVLLGVTLRRTTPLAAVAFTAVLFGLWHVPPALSDANGKAFVAAVGVVVGTVAVTTFAGVAFAWLRLRSRSLVAPILAHIATNSFAYVGAVVALRH